LWKLKNVYNEPDLGIFNLRTKSFIGGGK